MATRVHIIVLVLANVLIPFAVLVFAIGFFPYKPFLSGLATYENVPGYSGPLGAPFDKLIFMVVDALRSDFIYSNTSGFEFTQSLIRRGHALPYTAHATSPTITMPRVKAMTTGSIPSFLDVILNFAESDTTSTLAGQDTWLAQIRARGHSATGHSIEEAQAVLEEKEQKNKLVFIGDDTWLKLFPGFFERADGTSSFFVSDFTEVDNNVTRHVPTELHNSDWSGLIMHYLGLDHIGHKAGPTSPNMLPKQREMDSIVQTVYDAITDAERPYLHRTLLVLCGDHGMNDGGNHGGSSEGETSPALVFISPLLEMAAGSGTDCPTEHKGECCGFYETVEQSDVVPTLAGLLGVPVPKNNLGIFIEGALGFWDDEAQLQLLLQNARQVLNIVQATFPDEDYNGEHVQTYGKPSSGGAELALKWRKVDGLVKAKARGAQLRQEHLKPLVIDFLKSAQDLLSSTASNYNVTFLALGIFISALATLFTLAIVPLGWPPRAEGYFFVSVTLTYSVMMFASSYVEEEQHFWYWITGGWIVFLYLKSSAHNVPSISTVQNRNSLLGSPQTVATILLLLHRTTTRWTTTGVKHAGAASISSSFLPTHPNLLWALITFIYCYSAALFSHRSVPFAFSTFSLTDLPHIVEFVGAPGGPAHALLLAIVGLVFKISFTAAEAPELMKDMDWLRWIAEVLVRGAGGLGLVAQARIVFGCLAIAIVWVAWSERVGTKQREPAIQDDISFGARLQPLLTLFLITQSRAQNIPLFLIFDLEQRLLGQLFNRAFPFSVPISSGLARPPTFSPPARYFASTLTTLLLTYTTFFASGGSNAISSIDLSNAYNGVAGYEVGLVGILLFFGNWAGPVWWGWQGWLWVGKMDESPKLEAMKRGANRSTTGPGPARNWVQQEREFLRESKSGNARNVPSGDRGQHSLFAPLALLTLFTLVTLLAVQIACTALRTHLFIWTVFSPKYLYAMAWSVGWHLVWNCALGSLAWWLSRPW